MANIQVTHDNNVNNARSESAILVNPNNPQQIVAASKKFNNLHTYDFTLASSYSTDGGLTWQDSSAFALSNGATVMTDPTLAWDDGGGVYMLGLIGTNPPTFDTIGMVVYKSTDGGKTWGAPKLIHQSTGDDKQWMAGDTNPASPHHGNIYCAWDDGSVMRFARSLDRGATWIGVGGQTIANTSLSNTSFSPEVNVSANGNVFIIWPSGGTISLLVSKDGGDSFQLTTPPATGVQQSGAILHTAGGWPAFPGGNFRFAATATACVFGDRVVAAWDDFRDGPCRVYFALSNDAGANWTTTGTSGKPLITSPVSSSLQHFFPQLIVDPNGVIGCAFYRVRAEASHAADRRQDGAVVRRRPKLPQLHRHRPALGSDRECAMGSSRRQSSGCRCQRDLHRRLFRHRCQRTWILPALDRHPHRHAGALCGDRPRAPLHVPRRTQHARPGRGRRPPQARPIADQGRVPCGGGWLHGGAAWCRRNRGHARRGLANRRAQHHLHRQRRRYRWLRPRRAALHLQLRHRLRCIGQRLRVRGSLALREPAGDRTRHHGCGPDRADQTAEPLHPAWRSLLAQYRSARVLGAS